MKPANGLDMFDMAMLMEGGVPQDIGAAYGLARRFFPTADEDELHERISGSMLGLLERGLIVFFRAPIEDGYSFGQADVAPLTRDQVQDDFALGPGHVDDDENMLFFVQSPRGREFQEHGPS